MLHLLAVPWFIIYNFVKIILCSIFHCRLESFNKIESFWVNESPEPDISVKSEVEFDAKSEPDYAIIIENQIIPDNVTVSELETDVQVKSEPKAVVWIKSEPKAVVWIKSEPKEDIIEMNMELETEFDVGAKCDSFMVRLFKIAMQF